MKKRKMYQKIQAFKRQGYCRNEIASRLGVDPQTAAKYYLMDEREFRVYQQKQMFRDKVLQEHEKDILQVYEKNEFKKLNMSAVYDYLEERYGSLPGNEQTLRNYIHYLIRTDKLKLNESIRIYSKVPELPFGKQMQLDFGQYRLPSGLRLFIFAALLSASRYRYIIFQDHPFNTKEVICHLLSCFDYFGGVPREIVIDQDRLMVVSENAGDIIYTADFRYFIQEQDIRMYVCRKADPESKGKVENLIKYVKRNFLSIRDFKQVEEANEGAFRWLKRRANGKISQATQKIPALLIEHERKKLRPVCPSLFGKSSLSEREERNVNEKACISVHACNYQLPVKYQKKTVEIYQSKEQLFVFDLYTGGEIVTYPLSAIPGKTISKREFKREKEKTVQALKTSVLQMFEKENWKQFSKKNFKTFPRYTRDQCLEAKRYFTDKDIKMEILDRALLFCLENDTPSFANLKDTYAYFKREEKRSKTICKEREDLFPHIRGNIPHLKSAKEAYRFTRESSERERGRSYESLSTDLKFLRHPETKRSEPLPG